MRRTWKNLSAALVVIVSMAKCAPDIVGIPGMIDDLQVWQVWISNLTRGDPVWGTVLVGGIVTLIWVNFGERIVQKMRRGEGSFVEYPNNTPDDARWVVSVNPGQGITLLPSERGIFFQQCRFLNTSQKRNAIIDIHVKIKTRIQDEQFRNLYLRSEYFEKSEYQDALRKAGIEVKERLFKFLDFPIALAPQQMVEGQIEFELQKNVAARLQQFLQSDPRWIESVEIIAIDRYNEQQVSFPLGHRFDAVLGHAVEINPRDSQKSKKRRWQLGI